MPPSMGNLNDLNTSVCANNLLVTCLWLPARYTGKQGYLSSSPDLKSHNCVNARGLLQNIYQKHGFDMDWPSDKGAALEPGFKIYRLL